MYDFDLYLSNQKLKFFLLCLSFLLLLLLFFCFLSVCGWGGGGAIDVGSWKFFQLFHFRTIPYHLFILQDLNKHAFATQKMVLNMIKFLIKCRIKRNIFIENKLSYVKHILH